MKTSQCVLLTVCTFISPLYAQISLKQNENLNTRVPEVALDHQKNVEKIIYDIDFAPLISIPKGWRIPGNNPGNIYVENEALIIDGRSSPSAPTSILLPQFLEENQNYRVDIEFMLDQPVNPSRWGSIIYNAVLSQGVIPTQYFQFTIREDTTENNGTEFGRRLKNGQWQVEKTMSFSEPLQQDQVYKASVLVDGNQVRHYLNQKLMQDVELSEQPAKGAIGFSVAGAIMKVKNLQISQLSPHKNQPIETNQIRENYAVSAPPALIQMVSQGPEKHHKFATQLFYKIDKDLNLIDANAKKIHTLADNLILNDLKKPLVLEVSDLKTLEALKEFNQKHNLSHIFILSKQKDLLVSAHELLPTVRTVLDLSKSKNLSSHINDLDRIIRLTNESYTKIVILPEQLIEKSTVSYVQRRLMTVWAAASSTLKDAEVSQTAKVLSSGVNGIVTSHIDSFDQVLKQFPKNTLLRKPFLIGHRGVPSLEDENTIESAVRSVELGADIVENDIYLTKDNKLIVMHDNTVDRTTTGKGVIEAMTYAEVQQLRTKNKQRHIPLLSEYFSTFKKNKNLVLMVEMKSANPQLVPMLKAEIEKYGVEDQVVVTSFNRDQIAKAKQIIPQVSSGILIGYLPNNASLEKNTQQILKESQQYTSSYHPPYRSDMARLFEVTQLQGVTYWPWSLNDQTFKSLYLAGLNGLTTNDIQNFSKYVVDIQAASNAKLNINQALDIDVTLKQQNGEQFKTTAQRFIVLKGAPEHILKEGKLFFLAKGTAYVMAEHRYMMDNKDAYFIYSSPIKVSIQ